MEMTETFFILLKKPYVPTNTTMGSGGQYSRPSIDYQGIWKIATCNIRRMYGEEHELITWKRKRDVDLSDSDSLVEL